MAEHPNVQLTRDAYAAFASADLEGALKDLAPDAVFHFNGDGPISGAHQGREAIEKALIATFELTGGTQALDIHSVFADDLHAVVALRETATRTDGAKLDLRIQLRSRSNLHSYVLRIVQRIDPAGAGDAPGRRRGPAGP